MIENTQYRARIGCFIQKNLSKTYKPMTQYTYPTFPNRGWYKFALIVLVLISQTCGPANNISQTCGPAEKNTKVHQLSAVQIGSRTDLIQTDPTT